MKLEFDTDKGYKNIADKKVLSLEDYLSQPVIRWCHERIGPLKWPKDPNEILCGDGWEICADWTKWMHDRSTKPEVSVIIHKDINSQLVTDFWMRFQ